LLFHFFLGGLVLGEDAIIEMKMFIEDGKDGNANDLQKLFKIIYYLKTESELCNDNIVFISCVWMYKITYIPSRPIPYGVGNV